MAQGLSQFIGAAGQYYVAFGLAVRQINASLTIGNAPGVDVLAASCDGKRSISLQIKTARNAYRRNRYGNEGFEWDAGASVIGKHNESFIYAFVDLQEGNQQWNPRVFFVPSRWVSEFVKPNFSRFLYFLPSRATDLSLEKWDRISGYLTGNEDSVAWARSWPEDVLVKWGQ